MLLLSISPAALAADAALEAFAKGDFPTAKKLWEPRAAEGDPEAENGLGQMFMARWWMGPNNSQIRMPIRP
jgi:hypothetical protein